jgi:hypothetical protein
VPQTFTNSPRVRDTKRHKSLLTPHVVTAAGGIGQLGALKEPSWCAGVPNLSDLGEDSGVREQSAVPELVAGPAA